MHINDRLVLGMVFKRMMKISAFTCRALQAGCVLFGAMSIGAAGDAQAQNDKDFVIYCYDEATDVVTNRTPSQCDGKVISKEDADKVKQRRIARMRGAVSGKAREKEQTLGKTLKSTGSGFFVSDDGKLVTNFHVVDGCQTISVLPTDLERLPAKLLSVSKSFDFALLQVDSKPDAIVTFRAPVQRLSGQRIAVVGYPMNAAVARIRPYFTTGETMQPRRPAPGFLGLQFAADVRPGNSGGPLLDESGYVIGVVTAKINTVSVAQKTGEVVTNIGYATDNAILFQFLKANDVSVVSKERGISLEYEQIFASAKKFSVRIECWG